MTDKDQPKVPEHINEALFIEALKNGTKQDLRITEWKITPDVMGGNYCSNIYRVFVKYQHNAAEQQDDAETGEVHLLVKDLFESVADNSREHLMYTTVLPEMNELLAKAGMRYALSPKLYLGLKRETEMHIFEDLNAKGYVVCDRLKGFDMEEMKMVLWKLGQFHATSMVYKQRHPETVAGMKEFFIKSDGNLMNFIIMVINENGPHIANLVESWEGFSEIAKKIKRNLGYQFQQKLLRVLNKEDAKVRVLVHGDLWIKNILVLRNEQEVDDASFIDYQNCCDGSPALDIHNVFYTSASLEVLSSPRQTLIEHYYKSLVKSLDDCGHPKADVPSLDDINQELRRTEYFVYYDLLFPFPQTNLSEELAKDMNLNGFFNPKRTALNRENMFSSPRVVETLKLELKRLNDLGVLD